MTQFRPLLICLGLAIVCGCSHRAQPVHFFAEGRPEWFDEITSERAVEEAGVFEPSVVSGLFAKCARSGGEKMSNTYNMRVLAVISTQLTHESFVARNDWDAAERTLPEPTIAVDLVTDEETIR